jgi:nucleoside-diphosphate-sugar epimerase
MKISMTGWQGVLGTKFIETFPNYEYELFEGRIENLLNVENFVEKSKDSDALLHLASLVPRRKVESNPIIAFETNVKGTLNLLETFCVSGRSDINIIAASTCHVYKSSIKRISESDTKRPASWYGETKLQSEMICEFFRKNRKMRISSPRIFSYSDPNQSNDFFIPAMIAKFKGAPLGEIFEIPGLFGARDFIASDQVVHALNKLIEIQHAAPVNIGSGISIKLFEVINLMLDKMNRQDITIKFLNKENLNLVSNPMYLNSLGIEVKSDIDSIIDQMINK